MLAISPGLSFGDPVTEAAKDHNAEATKLFNLGKFHQALVHYEKAYQAKPLPEFLYNLAQCHRRLPGIDNKEKALFYLTSYLNNAAVEAEERSEVELERAALRREIDLLRQKQAPRPAAPVAHPAAAPTPPAEPAPAKRTPFYVRWWFWTIAGVVVAGATAVLVVSLRPEDVEAGRGSLYPGQIQLK